MIEFDVKAVIVDDPGSLLLGASDVAIVRLGQDWRMIVSAQADSALSVYDFTAGGIGPRLGTKIYGEGSGTRTVWDINVFDAFGKTIVAPATRYEDGAMTYTIGATKPLSRHETGVAGDLGVSIAVTLAAGTFVYTQGQTPASLAAFALNSALEMDPIQTIPDTGGRFLADISDLAHARVGTKDYLVVTSAFDAGLTTCEILPDGTLALRDKVAPGDGSGFSRPAAVLSCSAGGSEFIVMASAGSSSLTVYALGQGGTLTEVDHLIDSLDTRFRGAAELAHFTHEGRSYVVAAGNDDGLSVLELTAHGQLVHKGSLADTYDITLDNVSGLETVTIDERIMLAVTSPTDHGVTLLELSFPPEPEVIRGGEQGDYLRGTSGADVIRGMGGDDRLEGRGGADVLSDGDGHDRLEGGGGQDVFVFTPDGFTDVVTDFQPGLDQLDFSAYPGLNALRDLVVYDTCGGVMIHAGIDMLLIANDGSRIYSAEEINAQNTLF